MKKWASFIFLLSLIGLVWTSVEYHKTEWEEYQLGYKKYVSQKPGVFIEIFNKLGCVGTPVETHTTEKIYLDQENFPPFRRPFCSAKISGFLKVPETATYSLELASDDGAILYLDGSKALNNSGYHSFQSKKRQMRLKKGWHHLLIRYENEAGAAKLKLAWGKAGEERHPIDGKEIYLPRELTAKADTLQSLPPPTFYNTGILAKELLRWNQTRAFLIFLAFLIAIIFIFGNRVRNFFSTPESWLAVGIFLLALLLRAFHFLEYRQLRIQGILDGGDNQYFLLLPLRFVTNGEWISFHCGNLPLLIPLLGIIYKYFHFFPGIDYFSWFMIFLGSLTTLFPWLLLRQTASAWAGLVAGLFLATNPLLINHQIPYVSSDLLGQFTFALALFFIVKSLQEGRLSSYLLTGFTLALLPLSRTVFIPWAAAMAFFFFLFSQKRKYAFTSLVLFCLIILGYELLAWPHLHQSYFYYFLKDGFGGTTVHRMQEMPVTWFEKIIWLPHYFLPYLHLIFSNLLPGLSVTKYAALVSALFFCLILVAAFHQWRVATFLLVGIFVYLFEIASYHLHPRLVLPIIFLMGLIFAFGLAQFSSSRWMKMTPYMLTACLLVSFGNVGWKIQKYIAKNTRENAFLTWVKLNAPSKGVLLTEPSVDPWQLQKKTNLPVMYGVTYPQVMVIPQEVIPVRGVTFLSQQSQLLNPSPTLNLHRYVLSGLAQKGYHYLIIDFQFANALESYYLKNYVLAWLEPSKAKLTKIADYPADTNKGIWELKIEQDEPEMSNTKIFSDNFAQFLLPYHKRS